MPIADSPQSNKQHAVPQNIMDVEFKLIGDLTMRQFAYLLLFGLLAYLSYVVVIGLFKWPTVVSLALFGIGLAFVPIEERGLDEWVASFVRAVNNPTQRIWKKEPSIPTAFTYDNINVVRQEMITLAPTSSRRKLEDYLQRQDTKAKIDLLDIPEREYIMKVRQAFPSQPKEQENVSVSVIEEQAPQQVVQPEEAPQTPMKEEKKEPVQVESRGEKITQAPEEVKAKIQVSAPKPVSRPLPVSKFNILDFEYESVPITPDMHSGRKFTNLLPSQGEIVLPIRGERVIRTSEDIDIEEDVTEKAKKLQQLLKKIKEEEGIDRIRTNAESVTSGVIEKQEVKKEAKNVVIELKEQNKKLNDEIENLRKQISEDKSVSKETSGQEMILKKLEEEKQKIASSYTELTRKMQDLQKQLDQQSTVSTGPAVEKVLKSKIKPLTDKPDIVSGVVRDSLGRNMPDILLIVKNDRSEAVRAIKTNTVGEFILSTPLDHGMYTVEVSPVNRVNLTFDIIPIEIKGEIIPSVEMVGK